MSAKFLRREKALVCPVHEMILEEARTRLANVGYFSIADIIEGLHLEFMVESIRWDYIRDFLQEEERCELVPVVALFFKSPRTKDRRNSPLDLKPEKYLAMGNGKKTAGYVSVKPDEHAVLVLTRVGQRKAVADGFNKRFQTFLTALRHNASPQVRLAIKQSPRLLTNKQ